MRGKTRSPGRIVLAARDDDVNMSARPRAQKRGARADVLDDFDHGIARTGRTRAAGLGPAHGDVLGANAEQPLAVYGGFGGHERSPVGGHPMALDTTHPDQIDGGLTQLQRHDGRDGPFVNFARCAGLKHASFGQHDDSIGHRQGLGLVVGDEDHRRP